MNDALCCPRCTKEFHDSDVITHPENYYICQCCGAIQHIKCRGPLPKDQGDMNENVKISRDALEQIIGYYHRSHKHGNNTCYQMYREAEIALREMSHPTPRAADKTRCICIDYLNVNPEPVANPDCPLHGVVIS